MPHPPPADRLAPWERLGLTLLAVGVVAFGAVVVVRSAFQETRKTDFGVYARAAHAVRTGQDIYALETCDDNGWHYCYPPTLAIALVPLADPFRWEGRGGYLPYSASVTIWYLISVALVALSAHQFAKAVLPDDLPGSRRWWYARLGPVYVGLGALGYTLSRGQVNILVVAAFALMFAASRAGRPGRAGFWLAAAVAVKAVPGFLILDALVRRDWRLVIGLGVGLAVLLLGVPALVWGGRGAVEANLVFVDAVLAPGALNTGDQTRARELTNATATDSQSFQAMIHNLRHPEFLDPPGVGLDVRKAHWALGSAATYYHPAFDTRPAQADATTKLAHWLICAAMTLITLAVGFTSRLGTGPTIPQNLAGPHLTLVGCFAVVMLLTTPVSHVHYYAFAFPLVAGLWLQSLAERPGRVAPDRGTLAALVAWGAVIAVALLPFDVSALVRSCGGATVATVGLWAYGLMQVRRGGRSLAPGDAAGDTTGVPRSPETAP